jgi:hypothetical protein
MQAAVHSIETLGHLLPITSLISKYYKEDALEREVKV